MILICDVFYRVKNDGVILINLFMVQYHIGLMTYNYYYHLIRMIYHDTTLQIIYISVVYQLDRDLCPPSLSMTTFVITLLVYYQPTFSIQRTDHIIHIINN
jgi:hypothetical protein